MTFVINNGYAKNPISKRSIFAWFSKPPNDNNKKFGNVVEIKVMMTKTMVIKKTPHVTRFENCDSNFFNSKI